VDDPNLIPPGSVVGDAERRRNLERAVVKAAELTAAIKIASRVVPGIPGKVLGALVTGIEKDPETGRLRPEMAAGANFLPSPFGFLDPEAVGLRRNFYLPAGSTELMPRRADRLGIGIPQQRAEDAVRRATLDRQDAEFRARRAAEVIEGESVETLQDLAAGRGGFTRAGVLIASQEVPASDLARAAAEKLGQVGPVRAAMQRAINAASARIDAPDELKQLTAIDTVIAANPPDP